jgi:hypothetical protein
MANTVEIGGEVVTLHCNDLLASIRSRDGVSESLFVASEISLSELEDGGAKGMESQISPNRFGTNINLRQGGSKMQFTKNRRFLIKELSTEDHMQILQMSETYVKYLDKNKESLLIRFYYHFHRKNDAKVVKYSRKIFFCFI